MELTCGEFRFFETDERDPLGIPFVRAERCAKEINHDGGHDFKPLPKEETMMGAPPEEPEETMVLSAEAAAKEAQEG